MVSTVGVPPPPPYGGGGGHCCVMSQFQMASQGLWMPLGWGWSVAFGVGYRAGPSPPAPPIPRPWMADWDTVPGLEREGPVGAGAHAAYSEPLASGSQPRLAKPPAHMGLGRGSRVCCALCSRSPAPHPQRLWVWFGAMRRVVPKTQPGPGLGDGLPAKGQV